MDKPKVFIAVLLLFVGMLFIVLSLSRQTSQSNTFSSTIIANTLTQSLDGHRRYLTIKTEDGENLRLSAPSTAQCNVGQQAVVEQSESFFYDKTFKFVRCE